MKVISTDKAPAVIGPYSQARVVGNLIFASGQIPIIPETGALAEGHVPFLGQMQRIIRHASASLPLFVTCETS